MAGTEPGVPHAGWLTTLGKRLCPALLVTVSTFIVTIHWNQDVRFSIPDALLAVVLGAIVYVESVPTVNQWLLRLMAGYGMIQALQHNPVGMFEHIPGWRVLFGHGDGYGYLTYVILAAIIFAIARAVTPSAQALWQRWKQSHVWATYSNHLVTHVVIVTVFSLFLIGLMLLRQAVFRVPAIDFGIFDQALFHLSQFHLPASSIREYGNLFADHQHFSLIFLAPFYWIGRGFHGQTLLPLTPILLVTLPSIILYRTARAFQALLKLPNPAKPYWVASVAAILLFLHPFTQAAMGFPFHEKYLFPLFFSLLLWWVVRYAVQPRWWYVVGSVIALAGWVAAKEDQWLFAFVFLVTALMWCWKWKPLHEYWPRVKWFLAILAVLALAYGTVILPSLPIPRNPQYTSLYQPAIDGVRNFARTANPRELINALHLNEDASKYMLQHLMTFDVAGAVIFPANTFGDYAERLAAGPTPLRNPIFQYGVGVPVVSVTAFLLFAFAMYRRKPHRGAYWVTFGVIVWLVAFPAALGWNELPFLSPAGIGGLVNAYRKEQPARADFAKVSALIPADASLVASGNFLSHLSARDHAAFFPTPDFPKDNLLTLNPIDTYDYWLLDTRDSQAAAQVSTLENEHYRALYQGPVLTLLQRPNAQ